MIKGGVGNVLKLNNIYAGYNNLNVLWDISIHIRKGEFVCLVGPNGVGKTTTLRAVSGIIAPTRGEILFMGRRIEGLPAYKIARLGISFVTDNGSLFPGMTVQENLLLGAYTIQDKKKIKTLLHNIIDLFPRLAERKNQIAGTLSGGERKMLAIARGLMSGPELIIVDEPSLGLEPKLVLAVFENLKRLKKQGVTILMVEQNVNTTLKIVDRGYLLEQGRIVEEGTSQQLRENERIKKSYLGIE